ncbi:UDP-Glycosyltransferase/glycogen phosphorylase [Rhizoclosmatium globosum]|uniref:UDP-Glycosyltransferase/glycogen phosphorylase n=1 Tax=Rhizoclosmatium globosum TaxID=329046 RepID=A0A1Y2D081_9FUNG|nr:UDP-Glycosyltransferase/glycogen phosphorylase [Rhizoclosmatium globosum]|eukprot:ORY52536.1 UDP-Glycosyltransferase/glycogen phosphorylase [Rhizoclosmatium globosum]
MAAKNVALIGMGSRGDIQPTLCLATALAAMDPSYGIHVTVIVPENFYAWISAELTYSNVTVRSLPSNAESAINKQSVADQVVKGDPTVLLRAMADPDQMVQDLGSLIKWCANSDVVVVSAMSVPAGAILHEAFGTRVVQLPMFPNWYEPTYDFPPQAGIGSCGPILNKFLYHIAHTVMYFMFKPTLDRMRETAGLDRITWSGVRDCMAVLPIHHTWSPILHAKPKDWPESTGIGGYMFYDNPKDSLSPALEGFLNEGTAPVYVGFGSMPIHLSTKFIPLIKELLSTLPNHLRVVVYAGGMSNAAASDASRDDLKQQLLNLDPEHKRIFVTYSVPQRLLFPRCSVIVHHGGSGTTGEAIRSGNPSFACPLIGDQHFYARRIAAIGCGPRIGCSFKSLTGKKLGLKILEALETKYVARAKEVGLAVREERGTDNAVEFILRQLDEAAVAGSESSRHETKPLLRKKLQDQWNVWRLRERVNGKVKELVFGKKRN